MSKKELDKKTYAIVSYNLYGNFTNYGSALQTYALHRVINTLSPLEYESVVLDYCPEALYDKDPLDPMKNMWDQDAVALKNCEMTLPAIRINYEKFQKFFDKYLKKSKEKYSPFHFEDKMESEHFDGFVCGSDTVFCIDESNGFDDAFFANYQCMKKHSIAYAASFGDTKIKENEYSLLDERLQNFTAIGLRENRMLSYVKEHVQVPVMKTIDPTLLLEPGDYDAITEDRLESAKYLLLYTRRYNPEMESYAETIAKKNNWKIVEISLRAGNASKGHRMYYEAGVEEFLSLVKHAEYVVTNSFHGLMFSVQFKKQFAVFSRETGDSKIAEALELFGLEESLLTHNTEKVISVKDYDKVHSNIADAREQSLDFLKKALESLE